MSSTENQDDDKPIVIVPNIRSNRLRRQRDRATATIASLLDQIEEAEDRIKRGDIDKKTEAGRLLGDLKYWLRAARETEMELEAIIRKEEGIGDAYGLDLENARIAIGCRLDSLRACCREDEFPE